MVRELVLEEGCGRGFGRGGGPCGVCGVVVVGGGVGRLGDGDVDGAEVYTCALETFC